MMFSEILKPTGTIMILFHTISQSIALGSINHNVVSSALSLNQLLEMHSILSIWKSQLMKTRSAKWLQWLFLWTAEYVLLMFPKSYSFGFQSLNFLLLSPVFCWKSFPCERTCKDCISFHFTSLPLVQANPGDIFLLWRRPCHQTS